MLFIKLAQYLSQVHRLKVVKDPEEVNQLFLKRVNRRVNNDATISPAGRLFEVSPAFTGQRIEVAMNRVIWMRY
ncbi:MAG: hypothetical protein GXX09_08195 [Syntrophomonadaceae bacterium]|nr:hypothetical protein [Syntrophomonadaceae bacterium]